MSSKQVEQVFAWIVKIGLWAIPVLPLYVSSSLLFPFITGKNFAFRIIVEIIFAFWVGLAISNARYRPELTWLFRVVTLFIGIVFLADILSPSSYRSFFSNYERMEGFMMLGHLYLYFLMLAGMFKTRRDWLAFFHVSLAASFFVSLYAFFQRLGVYQSFQGGFRVDSTIGNPTYLAAYLWFHVWLLAILLYEFWKTRWVAALYGALLFFELLVIYFTATRGVTLAFVALTPLFLFGVVWFWKSIFGGGTPRVYLRWPFGRKCALAALVFVIGAPALLFFARDSRFVQSSEALARLTSYSLTEGTIQARFQIWGMSWRGFLERPLLGWGQENYYLVFQKYYNPGLFGEEPWFDRSHNIVFDWLIHAGFLGFAAYSAIFGMVFYGIASSVRKGSVMPWHGMALVALFSGYFFQNFFVFDNLNTYLLFFGLLGYAQYLPREADEKIKKQGNYGSKKPPSFIIGVSGAILILVLFSGYFLHIKPIRQGKALIRALHAQSVQAATIDTIIAAYQEALSYDSFGTTEVREQLGGTARAIPFQERFTQKEKQKFLQFAIDEFAKETNHPAPDVKHVLFLGSLYNRMLDYDPSVAQTAEAALKRAIDLSPTRQVSYLELGQFYLIRGDAAAAVDAVENAWELKKNSRELIAAAWSIAALASRDDVVQRIRKESDLSTMVPLDFERVAVAYQQAKNFSAAREIYALLVERAPENAKYHAIYAALLADAGNIKDARMQAEEAMRLDPGAFGEEGKIFLEQLRQRGR